MLLVVRSASAVLIGMPLCRLRAAGPIWRGKVNPLIPVKVPIPPTHWLIQNGLHWGLDVTFRKDDSRIRDRVAVRNLAVRRKIAINLMGRDRTPRISMRARRKQAAWNDRGNA
jgi:hypothetical protein